LMGTLNPTHSLTHTLRFNGHFPNGPALAGTRMSPLWILLELRVMEVVLTTGAIYDSNQMITTNKPAPNVLRAGCHSCLPANSVKALKGKYESLCW